MTEWLAAIAKMFERNLEAVAAALAEPTTSEPARARHVVELLVETLGGFAYGVVAGQLSRAVAPWFGPDLAAFVRSHPVPARRSSRNDNHDVRIARALAHAPLDLGHEFRVALQNRLAVVMRDLTLLVHTLGAKFPDDQRRMTEAMFSGLNRDSLFDDRLAREIATGWTYACAAIERRALEVAAASPRARDLWQTWSRMAGAPQPQPARDPVHSDGYITRVG